MPIPMPPKNKKEFSWGRFSKTLSFWILILLIPVILIQLTGAKSEASKPISYTEYRSELESNNVAKITITAGSGTRSSASPSRSGFGSTGESDGGGAPASSSIAGER